ncbi:MAG: hypothetical protein IJ219_10700 [Bacteroidaceae bacterium]|nr:hypothetical protein [Bacteroidaceae bacterium]MBQ9169432.1 hypothetical protein [Bacteroidaceae bacterium]MBQ9295377.1 hypothetical protein [Bacteroidaceae bacterium]
MKKTYQTPEALTVVLSMNNIIATSPLNVTTDGDTAGLSDNSATDGADALVKGKSLWDSEW